MAKKKLKTSRLFPCLAYLLRSMRINWSLLKTFTNTSLKTTMAEPEAGGKPRRLKIVNAVDDTDDTCQTFIMEDEDHTLGNALRYIITKSGDVQFCGYSIPHPSENKLNLRIQTHGKRATDVLEDGLKHLDTMCQHVLKTFESSVYKYKSSSDKDEDMV